MKILTLSLIFNLTFSFCIEYFRPIFHWIIILDLLVRILIGYGIYKLTNYLILKNHTEWKIKEEKITLILGILIGLFPFIFRNIYF